MHNEVDETRTKTDLVRGPARAHDEKMSVPYLSRAGKKKESQQGGVHIQRGSGEVKHKGAFGPRSFRR